MVKKVLITGINGFMGPHLARSYLDQNPVPKNMNGHLISNNNYDVYGIIRHEHSRKEIDYARFNCDITDYDKSNVRIEMCDLTDTHGVEQLIKSVQPDIIHHLAGQTYVPASWDNPVTTFNTNVVSTINILEAVRKHVPDCVVHIACSSEEYGKVTPGISITEDHPLLPLSPYGVSKIAQDKLGYQYNKSYALRTVVTRGFNHSGPGRGEQFVISSFAKQAVQCQRFGGSIRYGNLSAVRDFTHVEDMAMAYRLAATSADIKFGEPYNIGSGCGVAIETVKNIVTEVYPTVLFVPDSSRMRPSDVPYLQADASKFRAATGWEPTKGFRDIVIDLIGYWSSRVPTLGIA